MGDLERTANCCAMFACQGTAPVPQQTTAAAVPGQTAMQEPQQIMVAPQGHSTSTPVIDPIVGGCSKLCVKQEFSVLEMVGFGAKNRYKICKDQPETEGGKQFLYVVENSKCMERKCFPTCRRYSLDVHAGFDKSGPVVMTFTKNFHCPMTPCPMMALDCGIVSGLKGLVGLQQPPELTISEGETILGTVFDPPCPVFHCQMDAIIRNAKGEDIFHVGPTSMCTRAFLCPPICGSMCTEERVPITRDGKMVAELVRMQLSCAEVYGKCNRFEIEFGEVTDPTERKLVVGAAFLLDMQYWDQRE